MTHRIGIRSTGLVVFGGRAFSAFTGLLFIVMATRWLAPKQLGLWEVVIDLATFSAYPIGVVAYWATRDIARGHLAGRTAFVLGTAMSGFGLLLYFVLSIVTNSHLADSYLPFLLGSLLVPLGYWSQITTSIVVGYRPVATGYSLVVSEIVKIASAYEALYVYKLGIEGVILALIISYFVNSLVGTYMVRGATKEQLQLSVAKRWLRLSWLPAVSYLPPIFLAADTYIASLGFGTAVAGIYQPAFTVASVVGYSSALAYSLYPLLLRGGSKRLPAITIDFSLLFGIPMAVGGVVLADPILHLFGPKYMPGTLGLSILSVMFLFQALSQTVDQTLLGTEKADAGEDRSFRSLMKSNLIWVPLINLCAALVYLSGMYVVLSFAFSNGLGTSVAVALWAMVQVFVTIFFLIIKARRASRSAKLFGGASVAYYLVSALVMGFVVYLLSGMTLNRGAGTLAYGLELTTLIALGAAVYFGLLYALDIRFRTMAHSLMK